MIKTRRKSKSIQIAETLRRELLKNPPAPDTRMASATELAADCGISVPTAHNVLNLLVKEGLLYRKHGSGTFFARKKKYAIGILDQPVGPILPQEINAVLGRFCEYALDFLKSHNCDAKIFSYQEIFKKDVFSGLDGLLVSRLFIDSQSLPLLKKSKLPFVVYRCATTEKKDYSCCEFEIESGIKEALQYLKPGKNNRIFLFAETTPDSQWHKNVYCTEFAARQLVPEEVFSCTPPDIAVECYRTVRINAEKFRNSIIFCTTDVLAINLYNALLLENFQPGRDFRLIGVGNMEGYNSNFHNPPVISSIRQPIDTMSYEALKLLLRMIKTPTDNHTVIRIPTTFIPRKSSDFNSDINS